MNTPVIIKKLKLLNNFMDQMSHLFMNLNTRENEFEHIFGIYYLFYFIVLDTSSNRIMKITILIAVAMLAVCFLEYFYIKKFLQKKKVI